MPKPFTRLIGVMLVVMMALTACGGETPTSTPTPSNTPEPTNTPAPTDTPVPTVDVASLPAADLQATLTVLEVDLANAEARLAAASSAGEENAAENDIRRIEGQIEEVNALLAATGGEGAEGPVLTLSGDFVESREWTWAELEALGTVTATVAGPNDAPETEYTGISLVALLEAAGLGADATTLVATAGDDFTTEIAVAEVKACENCLIVTEEGALRLIMPGFDGKAWVSGLVSLEAR